MTRQRGNHQVERFRAAPAVRLGIGERLDDLQLLEIKALVTDVVRKFAE